MAKKTIAVDIDDVLSTYASDFVNFSNNQWGTQLNIEDILNENWAKIWQVDEQERQKRSKLLHTGKFFEQVKHFEESKKILEKLKNNYNLTIATSRNKEVKTITRKWVDKNFNGIFSDVHHAGIYDQKHSQDIYELTKADLLVDINADYLIDDQLKHCVGASKVGIKGLLFGEYPWNKSQKLPAGIIRVKDWAEVGEYFGA